MSILSFILYFLIIVTEFAARCSNITETKQYSSNSINKETSKILNFSKVKEKWQVINEGGPVLSNISPSALPKDDQTLLMSVDKDFGTVKLKPIKPRKGAKFNSSEESTINDSKSLEQNQTQNVKYNDNIATNLSDINKISKVKIQRNASKKASVTYKKPLILSYEALADLTNLSMNVETYLDGDGRKTSYRQSKIVVPIVIFMLITPMFILLGYMGLKKGKEAWKNRHYKRVDFLLDGMYKD